MKFVGLDATKKGWSLVVLEDGATRLEFYETFDPAWAAHLDASAVGVDIPIGLTESEARLADASLRSFVGPRFRSVFSTPCRSAIEANSYQAACAASLARTNQKISKQSYSLRTKILEVDEYANEDRLLEVHPEAAFAAMAGRPLAFSKRSWAGMRRRLELLRGEGIEIPTGDEVTGAMAADDVLDAAAVAWTARRKFHDKAVRFPSVDIAPQLDPETERPIVVWA